MKTIWTKLMNLSFQKKLVILVYSTILLMFLLLSTVLMHLYRGYSQEMLAKSKAETVNQVDSAIINAQKSLYNLADYFCIDPEVQSMLRSSNQNLNPSLSVNILRKIVTHADATSIVFYNSKGEVAGYTSTDYSSNPVNQNSLPNERPFHRLINGNSILEWEFIDVENTSYMQYNKSPKICLWHVVKDVNTIRPIGVIALTMDSRKLIGDHGINNSQDMLLISDQNGTDILKKALPIKQQDLRALNTLATQPASSFSQSIENHNYLVTYQRNQDSGFVIFNLSSYTQFSADFQVISIYLMTAIFLFVLLFFPILLLISRMLTHPLQRLKEAMLLFSKGDFDAHVNLKYTDEIGMLGKVFNAMVRDNKRLIDQTYKLQLRQKEAELNALQAQINPHFLYNLINIIHWKALRNGDAEVADITYSMGQVFRITLSRGNSFIPVKQEKNLIEYYLKLQKTRYQSRLEYAIQIDDNTLAVLIPKMILQALVENSIVHGMEASVTAVHIWVKVRRTGPENGMKKGGYLLIDVQDDGIGIPPEILKLLPDRLPEDGASGGNRFALKNISERLRLSYQEDYAMDISSVYGEGVSVHIKLPVNATQEEEKKC